MLAHKVLLPGATTLERFVAKLRHRVDVRVWRVLASGISPPQQRRLEDLLRVPDEGRSSSLVTLRTGAAMVSGPALVRALERLNAVRSLSITVPAAAARVRLFFVVSHPAAPDPGINETSILCRP